MKGFAEQTIKQASALIDDKKFRACCTVAELDQMPYETGSALMKQGCHYGQRKLLMTEIEFLSCFETNLVIYCGSAPCEHLPLLLQLFPHKKFLLIDPHFHTFDAKVTWVYQNVECIDAANLAALLDDLKSSSRRCANARAIVRHPKFYYSEFHGEFHDVTEVQSERHIRAMHRIQKDFEQRNYRTLISDMLRPPRKKRQLAQDRDERQDERHERDERDIVRNEKDEKHERDNEECRVFIIQDYLDIALCKLLRASLSEAGNPNFLFISDLRTNFFAPVPTDIDFMINDAQNLTFLTILRPQWSMLKFHPPYQLYDQSFRILETLQNDDKRLECLTFLKERCKLDLLQAYKSKKTDYFFVCATTVWLQAWAPASSSEARLIVSRADIDGAFVSYDMQLWDRKFQWLRYMRGYAYFSSFFESMQTTEYDACFDCALETAILLHYAYRGCRSKAHIDVDALAEILRNDEHAKDRLVSLKQMIDSQLMRSTFNKVIFHGEIRTPLKSPIFYVKLDKEHVTQAWCDEEEKIHTQLITDGSQMRLAKNLPPNKDAYAKFLLWHKRRQAFYHAAED